MDDKQYRRKLLIYSVMVVVASICGSGTPILAFVKLPSAAAIALGIAALFLFIYATIWFGSYLKLTSVQWFAAIALLLLAWAGSAIYMVTRKPNGSQH
jgi:hypothetical protein